jgi:hypothetical protein
VIEVELALGLGLAAGATQGGENKKPDQHLALVIPQGYRRALSLAGVAAAL